MYDGILAYAQTCKWTGPGLQHPFATEAALLALDSGPSVYIADALGNIRL